MHILMKSDDDAKLRGNINIKKDLNIENIKQDQKV